MALCDLSCFPFWFRGQDFGSARNSSWLLLTFHVLLLIGRFANSGPYKMYHDNKIDVNDQSDLF